MANLFNTVECWDRMSPEQQRIFGAATIAHLLGSCGLFIGNPDHNAFVAADYEAYQLMYRLVEEVIPEYSTNPPRPDLSVFGIKTCRKCGCTDNCGCDEGCSWVEEDLCSACVGVEK